MVDWGNSLRHLTALALAVGFGVWFLNSIGLLVWLVLLLALVLGILFVLAGGLLALYAIDKGTEEQE